MKSQTNVGRARIVTGVLKDLLIDVRMKVWRCKSNNDIPATGKMLRRNRTGPSVRPALVALLALMLLAACRAGQMPAPFGSGAPTLEPWPTPAEATPTLSVAATRTLSPLAPTLPKETPVSASPIITGQQVISATAAATLASGTPPAPAMASAAPSEPAALRSRLGVGVPRYVTDFTFDAALAQQLGMGWYLDWHIDPEPVQLDGLEYAQLYSMRRSDLPLQRDRIAQVIAANPGALWLAGNEPDVIWQDNRTPEEYARLYHEFYTFIKTLDPSAQLAIAGISQVTPLRLQYLERVLAAYQQLYGQPMPVDVWNIHAFILREERDSWGVSIPPGFDIDQGLLWEIEDHADLDLFKQQIVDFRRWMVQHGQREKPLLVSEFGILMPEGYGFPPDAVRQYMFDTFDYLLSARDPEIGLAADDNRLVQRFAWFSLAEPAYPTGNLVDSQTGALTPLGQAFADYVAGLD